MPYAVDPDHSDVPRSAARPLRYMDRYVTITQGDVFYITECLATLEGLEKGPAGNTSLAAAFSIAQEMPRDAMIVVQETEYTGAGKHVQPQLSFARENGIEVRLGDPKDEIPGKSVNLRKYTMDPTEEDYEFLAAETKKDVEWVKQAVEEIKAQL